MSSFLTQIGKGLGGLEGGLLEGGNDFRDGFRHGYLAATRKDATMHRFAAIRHQLARQRQALAGPQLPDITNPADPVEQHIKVAYNQFLGRNPEKGGLDAWKNFFYNSGGNNVEKIANIRNMIAASPEAAARNATLPVKNMQRQTIDSVIRLVNTLAQERAQSI